MKKKKITYIYSNSEKYILFKCLNICLTILKKKNAVFVCISVYKSNGQHIFVPGILVFVSLTLIKSLASYTVTSIKLTKKLNPILTSPRYGVPNIWRLTCWPGPSLPMNVVTSPSVDWPALKCRTEKKNATLQLISI